MNISNLSGVSSFGNEAYDDELSFMAAIVISDGEEYNPENKKEKYDFDIGSRSSNDISDMYCHFRYGDRKIRNEIHSGMQKMFSELHMSKS